MTDLPAMHQGFDAFVQHGIARFWHSGQASRSDLIALLLASGEAWRVAIGSATEKPASLIKGAAGVAGATVILRTMLSGPLGLVLAGISVGSIGAIYAKHHERIWAQVASYRALVEEYRPMYTAIVEDAGAEQVSSEQRDLMLEGLSSRFVKRLEGHPHVSVDE